MKLVFATHNRGKLGELRSLVEPYGFALLSAADCGLLPVDEDAETFAGNAEKKARAAHAATGLAALADDSGLEVDALAGAPGVRSARFAVEHDDAANNAKLLAALASVPDGKRGARFRCALAFVGPGAKRGVGRNDGADLIVTEGVCEGAIARAPRGAHGFGYDPLFLVGGGPRTMAELDPDEKNRVSHRGHAMRQMANALARWRGIP